MDHDRAALLDRRPLYPEVVAFGAPRGTRAVLKRTAETAGISVSELIRRTLAGGDTTVTSQVGHSHTHQEA